MHLEGSKNISISAENNGGDIARFIESEVDRLISKRLLLDGKITRKSRVKIVKTLTNGAQGMFRWVTMSLETLQGIKHQPDFMKALGLLPSKLSGLYHIIHMQIDQTEPYGRDVAIKTLKWLLCARRLLSVQELIAAIPVVYEVEDEPSSDSDEDDESRSEQKPSPEHDIIRLCRNLVVMDSEQRVFRFAHQSVQEYLLGRQEYEEKEQHALATERCLDVYLAELSPGSITPKVVQQNHFLKPYAQVYWPVHYKYVEDYKSDELRRKVLRFTGQGSKTSLSYEQWASDISSKYKNGAGWSLNHSLGLDFGDRLGHRLSFASSAPRRRLSAACAFGFLSFMKACELSSTDLNQRQLLDDAEYTLLHIAAEEGKDQVVRMLLDKGADVNAQGGLYSNALQAASYRGHDRIVQILLDKGADINAQGGDYGNALKVASSEGHDRIVQILLDKGADVNAQCGLYGSALQVASSKRHDRIVQILLDKEADINAQGGLYGNALQAASYRGHDRRIVQILLDKGADINAQGGLFGNALQAASWGGYDRIVQILLDKGADINAQGGRYSNALQAASSEGHNRIVQILLDRGADINAQGGLYGNALQAASYRGHDRRIVQILLDKGADINAQGGPYGNALQAASYRGHNRTVQIMLDKGADINAQGGDYGNALQAASYRGHDQVVQILLDKGADINAQGGLYSNALQAALSEGHDRVVQILLDKGADIN